MIALGILILIFRWREVEADPIIYEKLGLALTSIGWIGIRDQEIYTSLFIKLESPLLGINACTTPCGVKQEALLEISRKDECLNANKIGNGVEMRRVKFQESAGSKGLIETCLSWCLEEEQCMGIAAIVKGKDQQCILRSSRFSRLTTSSESRGEIILSCLMRDRKSFCADNMNSIAKSFMTKNNQTLAEIWSRSTQAIEVVRKLTNLKFGEKDRAKRSWMTAAPLAGVLVSGLSLYESFKVNKHVKDLDERFRHFCEKTVGFRKRTLEFEEQTINIIGGLARDMETLEEELQCEIRQVARQIFTVQRINEFEDYISNLLDPIARNRMDGPATLKVLDKDMLQQIAKGPRLSGTIYEDNPELLTLGRLILVDAVETESAFTSHLVLALPMLKKEEIYPLFKTNTVVFNPDYSQNANCGRVEMVEYVTKKGDEGWLEVDLEKCTSRGQVKLCSTLGKTRLPCLEQGENCQITGTQCRTEIKEIPSGILVNAMGPVKGVAKGEKELRDIPVRGYYSYSNFSSLVIDKRVVYSLEDHQTEVMWTMPTSGTSLDYVNEKIVRNPDLDKMRTLVRMHHELIGERLAPSMGTITELCAWISTGAWMIYLTRWGYLHAKQLWNTTRDTLLARISGKPLQQDNGEAGASAATHKEETKKTVSFKMDTKL